MNSCRLADYCIMTVRHWVLQTQARRGELSDESYDVIVVGAGPAGSWVAYELAASGCSVAVFDEKSRPGLDVCCTGIISTECFDSFDVEKHVVLTTINSARFFSPSGKSMRVQTEKTQAYVVDRSLLDSAIASKARCKGARYFFSSRVNDVTIDGNAVQAEVTCSGSGVQFSARAVVLASGYRPGLTGRLGLGSIPRFLVGAQAEVEVDSVEEVEVHFGNGVAPGSFAWRVPVSANKTCVGILAASSAGSHLHKFLNGDFLEGSMTDRDVHIRQKAIPLGTPRRTYDNRVLVVGDAAGQVKPTTGGGIYFGNLGARIAAAVLHEALREDDLGAKRLAVYEKLWKAKMGKELSLGYMARWLYARLSDRQIERIFDLVDSTGLSEALVRSCHFSFDWHSRLALAVLKYSSAYPWLRIRHLLRREAGL